jgi:hypothetical protein
VGAQKEQITKMSDEVTKGKGEQGGVVRVSRRSRPGEVRVEGDTLRAARRDIKGATICAVCGKSRDVHEGAAHEWRPL